MGNLSVRNLTRELQRYCYIARMKLPNFLPVGDRSRKILLLALPSIGGMTSQNLMNLIDTAMVGSLGAPALAGVGMASLISFMSVAVVIGLATAVQATAARRYGEEKYDETALPLNGGLILALLLGLPISVGLFLAAPWLFNLLVEDADVVAEGTPYLQARLLSVVAVGMNFAFRGYWNAVNLSRLYLYTLLMMHAVNVVLNYGLIFGNLGLPELGATGAGIGTSISNVLGTLIYFVMAYKLARDAGFLHKLPNTNQLRRQLKLGLPASLQQFMFSAGLTVLFWIVAQVGTAELAVANVLINITLVAVLPGIGLGLAAATLVGHALGRRNTEDAYRWAWDVSRIGVYIFILLGLPMLVLPDAVLAIFLREASLIDLGRLPLQVVGAGIVLDGVGLILMQSLLGAGATGQVMRVALGLQWLIFLPLAWLMGTQWGLGLLAIWLAFVGYRTVQTLIFALFWQRKAWARIEV